MYQTIKSKVDNTIEIVQLFSMTTTAVCGKLRRPVNGVVPDIVILDSDEEDHRIHHTGRGY